MRDTIPPAAPPATLTAGEHVRAEALAEAARAGEIGRLIEALAERAWGVRRTAVAALARVGDVAVEPLLALLETSRDDENRIAAVVDALAALVGDTVDGAVIARAERETRAQILADHAQVLGRRRARAALPVLVAMLSHEDDNVAVAAVEALGRIGDPAAVEPLAELLARDPFFRAFAAIDVLGRSDDPRAVPALAGRLSDPVTGMEAARALGRVGDRDAVQALVKAMAHGHDTLVRAAAIALGEIDERFSTRFGAGHTVAELVSREVGDDDEAMARRIAQSLHGASATEQGALCRVLAWSDSPSATGLLVDLLGQPGALGAAAAQAVGLLGASAREQARVALRTAASSRRIVLLPVLGADPGAVDDVAGCLTDDEAAVRVLACESLGAIGAGARRATVALATALGDDDPRVVQAAAGALVAIGGDAAGTLALDAVRSARTAATRRAALRVVAALGPSGAYEALAESARDRDARVRETALLGLGRLTDERAHDALLVATQDGDPGVRALAWRSLGRGVQRPVTLDLVKTALADDAPWVRYHACQAIGALGDARAAGALARMLHDPAGHVRLAALDALAQLATPEAVSALREALASDDADVRRAGLLGLSHTGDPEALVEIERALDDDDAATRLVAVSALANLTDRAVVGVLARATRDADDGVRTAALAALTLCPGADATVALVSLLGNDALRAAVITALATPVDGRVPALLARLEQADAEQAPWLVAALARQPERLALPALALALAFARAEPRRAAALALAARGSPSVARLLALAASGDSDATVRRAASLRDVTE